MTSGAQPLTLRALPVHATSWRPSSVVPLLNLELDASLVEDSPGAPLRFDAKSLLVLDGLVDEPLRRDLLEAITGEGWEASRERSNAAGAAGDDGIVTGDPPDAAELGAGADAGAGARTVAAAPEPGLPLSLWERETRDQADKAPTWGLKGEVLAALLEDPPAALREVRGPLEGPGGGFPCGPRGV